MGHHNNHITIKDILSKHDNMYDVSYMFTQPITLIFDGETLKIYENGLELDGYDARSGKVEKRKEIPAKSVNTEDNQTLNTVANEEDNVTQAEEKNNLNLIDDEDSIKKVVYPGVSASATLAQDYNGKYYYYDEKNTTKIPEGEYYILVDEPSKSSSTDNAGTQSNEIIVGEPSKYQDKLGERYIEIYKSSELLFNNEDSFNQSINNRKAETKENFGWFGNKTSYLIHGGTDYEDNCGIDLSSAINTFCSDLSDKIINNYNNGNIYTTYGKVPIKLNVSYKSECIFPLKMEPVNSRNNSKYSLYAWDKEETEGLVQTMFGSNRDKGARKHGGIDLYTGESTSGEVVAIADGKVLDTRKFYNTTYQISIYHEINGKPYIVRYGELLQKSITHKIGDTVSQGEKLGETGVLIKNGNPTLILNNKPMRMLHFEVFNMEIDGVSIDELKKIEENSKYVLTNFRDDLSKPKYNRRKDIINPLEILKQGYEASKKSGYIK